ncbi:MAG: hypothetical protein HN742_31210 [Lentisphaerae bacterium]|nr:hypothetical protein [Lentisphaerota bacterium]MBT4816855.1 hypothetical protein [Lentisphaerota bacterium]MBT5612027.1 hypothetical protein [Lentisphaerota bacterium]MBT7054775.1 hypothetical protein [Lentisphaerota bacterium]MBT7846380.1 hypothetical protein [Lentisphaerota bacterium]
MTQRSAKGIDIWGKDGYTDSLWSAQPGQSRGNAPQAKGRRAVVRGVPHPNQAQVAVPEIPHYCRAMRSDSLRDQ